MAPDLEGRAEYLSLALFAQSLVTELNAFVKSGDSTTLISALQNALTSLKAVESGKVSVFARRDAVAFNSYQQLTTLSKAWSDVQRNQAIKLIIELVRSPSKKVNEAGQLIDLFTQLQVQALWSFEQPEAPPTEGLRELCRMAP